MKTNLFGCVALSILFLAGCGAGSARDVAEVQPPKMGGRMGLSAEDRIQKIKDSNMSDKDKADRIALISGSKPK